MWAFYLPVFIGLVAYLLLLQLVVWCDLRLRRYGLPVQPMGTDQSHRFLNVIENGVEQRITDFQLYPANWWTLQRKWLSLTGPLVPILSGTGAFFFAVIRGGGEPLLSALLQTASIMGWSILLIVVPILVVYHLFGERAIGLIAYAEYGVADAGLLYRPFYQWHLIPWTAIVKISPDTFYLGKTPGLRIYVRQRNLFPTWYQRYLWGRTQDVPLLLLCLLPNSRQLVREICTYIGQSSVPLLETTFSFPRQNPASQQAKQ